jgi:mono/diheme cytochrome c family protein
MVLSKLGHLGILGSVLAASVLVAYEPQARSIASGVYTSEQAARGQTLYQARCQSCHGNGLAGRTGPALVGDAFLTTWSAEPLLALGNKIRKTMPRDESERLTVQQTADLLAYMLQAGKFPAGNSELRGEDAALMALTFPPRPAGAQSASATAAMPTLPPGGNMAQLMRGLLFPNSNIIFTVQSHDPGVKRPERDEAPTDAGFDWYAWGGGIYKGWDAVDYAAVTLADSAQLMLTPGRVCENGRPVPVTDPDWIRLTMELAEAGKAAYKAAQTRDQETVSKNTEQLNNSCSNCHRVFRGRTRCVKP